MATGESYYRNGITFGTDYLQPQEYTLRVTAERMSIGGPVLVATQDLTAIVEGRRSKGIK